MVYDCMLYCVDSGKQEVLENRMKEKENSTENQESRIGNECGFPESNEVQRMQKEDRKVGRIDETSDAACGI